MKAKKTQTDKTFPLVINPTEPLVIKVIKKGDDYARLKITEKHPDQHSITYDMRVMFLAN